MSSQPQPQSPSIKAKEADLERTAELPVLDVAAYEAATKAAPEVATSQTDTWVAPSAATPGTGLDAELHAVSTSLRELEGRLMRKGETLAALETEIRGLQAERTAALARADSETRGREELAARLNETLARADRAEQALAARELAGRALEERGSQLAADAEHLRTELRLAQEIVADRARQLELRAADIAARDERIGRLEAESREAAKARDTLKAGFDSATARANALQADLETTRAEFKTAGRELSDRGSAIAGLESSLAQRERELTDARAELGAVRERLHTYLEALSTREGQRGVYEQMYAELESRVGARDTEVSAQSARADRLVGELETLRGELEERLRAEAALRAQLEARAAAELAVAEKIKALEHQAADHGEVLRGLREELTRSQARTQELEADLRAAEETIHSQEADVRARSAQHEELLREQKGLRTLLEEARTAVEQRDARIRSLEASAVKSHAALDHIQQSMQRLDPLAVTGVDPPVESAARLLVRKDGDVEVVHVLGRRTTVGRTSENDLQIDTKFISRHHAIILCGPVYTIIEDLKSTNGVLVNNRRVARQTLKDGDAVTIGKTLFRFVVRPTSPRN